jgi:hypothetical protein
MIGVPAHRSGRFRLAALGIILLTIAIRLPSLVHPRPIDSEAMYSVVWRRLPKVSFIGCARFGQLSRNFLGRALAL